MSTLWSDCRRWLRAMAAPLVAFLVALLLVTAAAYRHNTSVSVVSAIVLLATVMAFGHYARQERVHGRYDYDVGRARLVVSGIAAAVALVLIALSRAFGPDAIGFVALGILIVAGGGGVSEIRQLRWQEGRRGPVVLAAAFFVLTGSVIVLSGLVVTLLLLGLVAAELGSELFSEDYLRTTHRWSRGPVAALGVGLLLVAVGLLIRNGAGGWAALIVVIVMGVVVWMTASDSDSLLLVMVVGIALLVAAAPQPASHDPGVEAVAGQPFVLVLGDSYISGEGASKFFAGTNTTTDNADFTNECRRAPTAWPFQLAERHIPQFPSRVLFLACSGAETRNLRATPPVNAKGQQNGPAELDEYTAARAQLGLGPDEKPALVVLSLGGNDAGFSTIGETCIGPGDCAEIADRFLEDLRTVEGKLDASYADIKAVVGADVPVVVTGYPIPITESGPCANVLLTDHERRFVVAFVKELNHVVHSAATRAGFDYMDSTETALVNANNRLCERTNPVGMNFIGFNPKAGSMWDLLDPSNWFHNSVHPNEIGHAAIAAAAAQWFADNPNRHAPVAATAAPYEVQPMEKLFEWGFIRRCDPKGDTACTLDNWETDQRLRLVQQSILPLTVAIVGAWMIVIGPLGWAAEHDFSVTNLVLAALRWMRGRRH